MNWTLDDIIIAISADSVDSSIESALALHLYSSELGIGVGVDPQGRAVLVLPGQSSLPAFETSALKFDPWCDTLWVEHGLTLPKCSVLRCRFDRDDTSLTRIVSGVLQSLIDLQLRFQDAGQAVWVMRNIFADGFRATPDRSTVLGLLGELTVLLNSPDIVAATQAWHVDKDDRYDFSWHSRRLEVKATTSALREHRFSSFQLPPLHGIEVWVASVQLAIVEVGLSAGELYERIADNLPLDLAHKVAAVITETVGLPPTLVTEPQLDLASSVAGIRLYPSVDVPTPMTVPDARDLRWTAFLDEAKGLPVGVLDDLLPRQDSDLSGR